MRNLNTERIDFLQWLYRTEPIEDGLRIRGLEDSSVEIEEAFSKLLKEGLVGEIGSFPYSIPFGLKVANKVTSVTGWITYFNLLEQENIKNLPQDYWLIGIRPLAAGSIFQQLDKLEEKEFNQLVLPSSLTKKEKVNQICLAFCLAQKKVTTNILSINSMAQAESLQLILRGISSINGSQLERAQELLCKQQI